MARRSRGVRRDAAGWQAVVERQAQSGVSRKVFCEREGIPRSSFETWRRRLASRAEAARFVELAPVVEGTRRWDLEVALPGGVTLRIRG
jgi:hypothetical protein